MPLFKGKKKKEEEEQAAPMGPPPLPEKEIPKFEDVDEEEDSEDIISELEKDGELEGYTAGSVFKGFKPSEPPAMEPQQPPQEDFESAFDRLIGDIEDVTKYLQRDKSIQEQQNQLMKEQWLKARAEWNKLVDRLYRVGAVVEKSYLEALRKLEVIDNAIAQWDQQNGKKI